MPITEMKCKNCGGIIEVDDDKSTYICKYCDTPYTKEDLIVNNEFHYHNQFDNATVIVNDERSIEARLKNAEFYLTKRGDLYKAQEIYEYVIEYKGSDYRGWWGMVRVLTENFTVELQEREDYEYIKSFADTAMEQAPKEVKEEIQSLWNIYSEKQLKRISKIEKEIEEEQRRIDIYTAKKHRNAVIRKTIAIVLSLASNIAVIAGLFIFDIHKLVFDNVEPIIAVLIALAVNMVITTILGFIGSTDACCGLPGIAALVSAVVVIHGLLFDGFTYSLHTDGFFEFLLSVLLIIGFIIVGLVVVGICFAIPFFLLSKYEDLGDTDVDLDNSNTNLEI